LLQADRIAFGYGHRPQAQGLVIDEVSLAIRPGALVGILGPNGSGKTTLLRLLAGTLKPLSGTVSLDGRPIATISRLALARRFAMVPQETHLAFDYSVLEIVLMGRYPHLGAFEMERPDDIASALRSLEATGTASLAARQFQTLSGGEKQRVIIASALAQLDNTAQGRPLATGPGPRENAVLFLDEPTASLDLRYQIEVAELIRRLHREHGMTVVLSTHDLHLAAAVCEEIVLLRSGRVLAQGTTGQMLTEDRIAALYELGEAHRQAFDLARFALRPRQP
jgi:iron complex transport system ATP-binding protein